MEQVRFQPIKSEEVSDAKSDDESDELIRVNYEKCDSVSLVR